MSLSFELTRRLCSLACVLGSRWTQLLPNGTASLLAYTNAHPKMLQRWPGISLWDSKSICTGPVSLEQQRASKGNSQTETDSLPLSSASHMTSKSSKQQRKASRPRVSANGDKEDKSRRRHDRQQKGLDPASVCRALVALGKAGRADEAESLWNQCQANGMLADEKLVGALCANFAEAAEPEKIEIAISKGKQAGLFPISSAYSSLLKAYGQCRQWPQVREVLIGMIQSGVPISKLHYKTALRAYHQNNRSFEAELLLNEMISQSCELGASQFQLLADIYANRKQSHMVEDVLRRWVALGRKVTGVMCAISAKAYAHQGEPDQVKRILAEMRQNSLETKPQVWGSLVHALVNAGQLDGALEVMSGLQSSGVAPRRDVYNMIINAHLKRDDEAGALYYWQHMTESGVQPQLYDFTSFMHYYSLKGNVRVVKEWQAAIAEHGITDTGEAALCVIEASMGAWWLHGCQNLVLITAEQDFMQLSILMLYPIFRYARGRKGVYSSTEMDLHRYNHWSCQLALLAGLSMMYDRFLHTTWQWPKSEDLKVLVGKGSVCLTERRTVKDAAWHFLEKLFVVRMATSGGAIVVKRLDVLDWFHALKRKGIVLNAVHCKQCFSPCSSRAQGR